MVVSPLAEQFFHLENIASSILVSERQLPDLHNLLLEACQVLDLEPPQLYVRQNPVPNAYTFAMRGQRPFVVIHTSLLELLTPEETQAVIAHELGHLKCDHSLYLTLANLITLAAYLLPGGEVMAQNLQLQILGMGALCRIYLRSRRPAGRPGSSHCRIPADEALRWFSFPGVST